MYFIEKEKLTISVCQKWKEATELSWHSVKKIVIDDSTFPYKNKKSFKKILRKCCQYLKHLTITVPNPWMHDIDIKLDYGHRSDCYNYYEKILQVIASMSKLKNLKVVFDSQPPSNLCPQIFDRLPDHVDEIDVTLNSRWSATCILVIITLSLVKKSLRPLLFSNNCRKNDGEIMEFFSPEYVFFRKLYL